MGKNFISAKAIETLGSMDWEQVDKIDLENKLSERYPEWIVELTPDGVHMRRKV